MWSSSKTFLGILAEVLSRAEYGHIDCYRFDGDLDKSERSIAIDGHKTGSGGAGLNMPWANYIILCETDWNHQDHQQLMDGAHRNEQTKECYVIISTIRGQLGRGLAV